MNEFYLAFSNPYWVESDDDSPSPDDLTIKIEICDAIGLSPTLAHFVECQYTFPGSSERVLVPPTIDESLSPKTDRDRLDVRYNHSKTMTIEIEPDTLDQFERGALQIELMGHQERPSFYRKDPFRGARCLEYLSWFWKSEVILIFAWKLCGLLVTPL